MIAPRAKIRMMKSISLSAVSIMGIACKLFESKIKDIIQKLKNITILRKENIYSQNKATHERENFYDRTEKNVDFLKIYIFSSIIGSRFFQINPILKIEKVQ